MARLARKKRESILAQQVGGVGGGGGGGPSSLSQAAQHQQLNQQAHKQPHQQLQRLPGPTAAPVAQHFLHSQAHSRRQQQQLHLHSSGNSTSNASPTSLVVVKDEPITQEPISSGSVWRPWSHQVVSAFSAQQHVVQQKEVATVALNLQSCGVRRQPSSASFGRFPPPASPSLGHGSFFASAGGDNMCQPVWQAAPHPQVSQMVPRPPPLPAPQTAHVTSSDSETHQRSVQEQQLFSTIFGLLVAQLAQPNSR